MRQDMKKWAVAVGIILLILTPFLLTQYNVPYGTVNTTIGSWPTHSTWETAANFSENDIILLAFSPNIFWSQDPYGLEATDTSPPIAYTIVDINLTDPNHSVNETQYELWFAFSYSTQYQYSVYNATLLSVGDGINRTAVLAPTFSNVNNFVLGTAESSGTYFGNVTFVGGGVMYPGHDYRSNGTYPPANFAFNWAHTVLRKSYPYASLLYVSFLTIPASVAFMAYGLRKARLIRRVSNKRPLKT